MQGKNQREDRDRRSVDSTPKKNETEVSRSPIGDEREAGAK